MIERATAVRAGSAEAGDRQEPGASQAQSPDRGKRSSPPTGLRRFLWENSLSLVLLGLFLFTLVGQIGSGLVEHNNEQKEHGRPAVGLGEYLTSGHFIEATAENWESEFLQMGMFIVLTVFLRQKGSAESKKLEGEENVDEDPRDHADEPDAPWPVKKGGLVLWLYSHSLAIAFGLLFLVSFLAHAWSGANHYSEEQLAHGEPGATMFRYMGTSRFWFESFQNWQSEFLSIAAMVILTIWLRQHGSPESKPVHHPHAKTATDSPTNPPNSGIVIGGVAFCARSGNLSPATVSLEWAPLRRPGQ